jgi:hypothetical protein
MLCEKKWGRLDVNQAPDGKELVDHTFTTVASVGCRKIILRSRGVGNLVAESADSDPRRPVADHCHAVHECQFFFDRSLGRVHR